jgi:REP element-mobilizing transposase RayT
MPLPRQVLPGAYYMLTRRCSERRFLLRPDRVTNNAYLYCLIEAALRFEIDVVIMCMMSNHHHLVIRDRFGRYPEFIEHLHRMIARSQNALRGRWENFWASGQTSVVRLVDREDVIRKAAYVAANPVQDQLVDRVDHWPGINGLGALLAEREIRAERPHHFFRKGGPMPQQVAMRVGFPEELGDPSRLASELELMVRRIERDAADERIRTGLKVIGRAAVLKQKWNSAPRTFDERRAMSPRVAAVNRWSRLEALLRNKVFERAYAHARSLWREGANVLFPPGTYWLRRFANVAIAES